MSDPISPPTATYEIPQPVEMYVAPRHRQRYWLHALLLLATIFTTLVVGARMQENFISNRPAFSTDDDALPLFPLTWTGRSYESSRRFDRGPHCSISASPDRLPDLWSPW
jgi:hypothetical protein